MTPLTSLVAVGSKIHRRPQSPDFQELCLGIFEVLFCKCTESHARTTSNPTFQKTTTVDFKMTYKNEYKKIHEMQGIKFLQNKHCSVYETEH